MCAYIYLPSCNCIHTPIWIHHMDTNKMHREKAIWELHKNAAHRLEQIVEATSHQTAASYLTCLLSHKPFK